MTLLSTLSMRRKLLLPPMVAVVLMVLSSIAVYQEVRQQRLALESIYTERIPAMKAAVEADRTVAGAHANAYKVLAMMDSNFPADQINAASNSIKTDLEGVIKRLKAASDMPGVDASERDKFNKAAATVVEYQKSLFDAIDIATVQVSMATAYMSKAQTKYEDLSAQFNNLCALEDQHSNIAYQFAETIASRAKITVIVMLILSVAFSIVVARYVSNGIVRSIQALKALTARLSEGDLSLETADQEPRRHSGKHITSEGLAELDLSSRDELGDLARSFSKMVVYLKEMAAISEFIAGGDLSHRVEPRSSRDTLGHAFARMTDGLSVLVRNVRESGTEVASASSRVAEASVASARVSARSSSAIEDVSSTMQEMNVNTQSVARHTLTQVTSVNETSASIEQMSASIARVASSSRVLIDIAARSRHEVDAGLTTMGQATAGLNLINTSIRSSAEIIDVLGDRANDIGKIVEVIDELADQTNLLSLNAAIEAARAGEHGLGFAVVADEVRKLAEKSAKSTQEISALIQSIQKQAREGVTNMERSTSIVNDGLKLGSDLNSALTKISQVVSEVHKFASEIGAATNEQALGSTLIVHATSRLGEITSEITSSIEEQATGTQAVVKAMEEMRHLVRESASSSTGLAASAEQMSHMSRNLLEVMDGFRLQGANEKYGSPTDSKPATLPVQGARKYVTTATGRL
jgi:methyl-accepting chemotaxis protein